MTISVDVPLTDLELDCLTDMLIIALEDAGEGDTVMGWKTEFINDLNEKLVGALSDTVALQGGQG